MDDTAQINSSVPIPKRRPSGRVLKNKQLSFVNKSGRSMLMEQAGDGETKLDVDEEDSKISANEPDRRTPRRSFKCENAYGEALYEDGQGQTGVEGDIMGVAGGGMVDGGAGGAGGGFPDEEVLEQYRMMAYYEARDRVRENTGLDVETFDRVKKKDGPEPTNKKDLYGGGKKPKLRMPEPKLILPVVGQVRSEKAPSPPCGDHSQYIDQKAPRVPEMDAGTVHRGTTQTLSNTEHVVRCLGCRSSLKVNFYATLVSCPECQTVSSTSSTRI